MAFSQLGKAQDAAREQMEDDHHLPAPFQNTERAFDSARRHVGRDVFKLTGRWVAYFFVGSCHQISIAAHDVDPSD
jgi:hypothetical protein